VVTYTKYFSNCSLAILRKGGTGVIEINGMSPPGVPWLIFIGLHPSWKEKIENANSGNMKCQGVGFEASNC
jgi:hypothetical protein